MSRTILIGIGIALAVATVGCIDPSDRRPGTRLSGDVVAAPSDWSFTNDYKLIAVEVQSPYLLPHSVTIWCAAMDGQLYIGARQPESKRWPGWTDRNPNVRLGIGTQTFEVRLVPVEDPERIGRIQSAYATKYDLPPRSGESPPIRYWSVRARS
jgi:hypothetical protein